MTADLIELLSEDVEPVEDEAVDEHGIVAVHDPDYEDAE